ncbi:MAG: WD40 repeat domain-containing serine/threonine-protein kinase [Isosphaeraceae bacterium]
MTQADANRDLLPANNPTTTDTDPPISDGPTQSMHVGDPFATVFCPNPRVGPSDPGATIEMNRPSGELPASEFGGGSPTGRYRILRSHARGGLGEVFLASDGELKREVALKAIQERHADDPQGRARFVLEAEVTGNLEHPGIVPVYGLGYQPDGRPYYAMRFIKGDSLKEAITRFHAGDDSGRDPRERLAELRRLLGRFLDVCDAIEYAHSRGVLHRDLKPANVMLGPYGETLVVDWGLAKTLGSPDTEAGEGPGEAMLGPSLSGTAETLAGSAIGTPQYMSPEQAAGKLDRIGPTSDVYSLGATLYCILTGQSPVEGDDVADVLRRVTQGEIPNARQIRRDVPRPLEAICLKAMALQPRNRYATPRALADDVERWLADEPVSAWREPRPIRIRRWVGRHRSLVLMVGVGAVVALLGLAAVSAVQTQANLRLVTANRAEREAHRQAVADRLEAEVERKAAHVQRLEAQHQTASLDLEHGQTVADGGETGLGMLWMVRGLELATRAGDADLQRVARANLAHYRLDLHAARVAHPSPPGTFSPDGGSYLVHLDAATFEVWDLKTGQLNGTLSHPPAINAIAFAPDSKSLITAGQDGKALIWKTDNGQLVERLHHDGPVLCVDYRPDGRELVTGCADQAARLWTTSGEPLSPPLAHPGPVVAVGFGPANQGFWTKTDQSEVFLWGTGGGRMGGPLEHSRPIQNVAYRPDGQALLVSEEGGLARLWNATNAKLIGTPMPHVANVPAAFSPDGTRIWTLIKPGVVQLWDARTVTPVGPPLQHTTKVLDARFSPGSRALLVRCADGKARLWNAADAKAIGEPLPLGPRRLQLFNPAGERFLTDGPDGISRLWETKTGSPVAELWYDETVKSLLSAAYSPDGSTLLTGEYRLVYLRDADTGRPLDDPLERTSGVNRVAFSPNGRSFLTETPTDGVQVREADVDARLGLSLPVPSQIASVAYSPDSRFVATTSKFGTQRWNAETGLTVGDPLPSGGTTPLVEFSRDGRSLFTSTTTGALIVDTKTGTTLATLDAPGLIDALYTPDSRLVVTTDGRNARVWNARTGKPVGKPMPHNTRQAYTSLDLSPDGETLVTVSDRDVQRWQTLSGELKGEPLRHAASETVFAVAYSPDGRTIATGFQPGGGRLWDAKTGQAIASLPHQGLCEFLAYTPDGKTLLSGGQDRAVQAWDASTGRPLGPPLRLTGGVWRVVPSPDGASFAVLTSDGPQATAARLWDRATGKPLGPPLRHQSRVFICAFAPDGRTLLTGSVKDDPSRLWTIPDPVPSNVPVSRVALWVQVLTGMELTASDGVRILNAQDWRQRHDELNRLGGPPLP